MEIGIGIAGLVIGAIISYLFLQMGGKKAQQAKIDEMNGKADLVVKEARLTASRITDEAKTKADRIVSKADSKNESIKQKKISEAKERFAGLKSDFESYKSTHKVEIKEREMEVVKLENDLKDKQSKFQSREDKLKNRLEDIETREVEIKTIRENLDTQIRVINKKKEELETANEKHIKALSTLR